jgi:uncharacterized protein GlcG (DUF336 family)
VNNHATDQRSRFDKPPLFCMAGRIKACNTHLLVEQADRWGDTSACPTDKRAQSPGDRAGTIAGTVLELPAPQTSTPEEPMSRLLRSARIFAISAAVACLLPPASAQMAQAPQTSYALRFMSPETALKAAQAALARCRAQGFQVAVAVVDRSGVPQVVLRDRYAGPHTVEMAVRKAWTAASFRRGTSELAAETQAGRPMSGIRDLPGVIAAGGALPIDEGGTLWGAVGVSGGPGGEADEDCAGAGVKAVSDELAF